jgi:hypothetical protein
VTIFQTGRPSDPFTSSFSDIESLPDYEKERLCRDLLEEFGATVARTTDKGELVHSCVLPYGLHSHGDRNPSASLNYKTLLYNCYACGGGGLLWFIGVCRGTSGTEARKWLSNQSGGGTDEQSLSSLLEFFDEAYGQGSKKRPEPIPHMDPRVLSPYLKIHPYLTEQRGCDPAVLQHFMVGYGEFRTRIGEDAWVESPRIVIPHFWRDTLVGWQSRRLLDDGTAKYLNTPEFPKDRTIYNWGDRPKDRVVVVESTLSVLRHATDHHMVATFGAEVTETQVRILGQAGRAILWFDNDPAGWKATESVGQALADYTTVYAVDSPWAGDAGDLPADEAKRLIDGAVPFALWRPPEEPKPLEGQ